MIWLLACNRQAILREFWSGQTLWGRLVCKYLQERDGDYKSSVCGNWSRESQGLSRPRTRVKHFGQERNKVAARRKSGKNTSRGAAPFRTWDWSLWNVGWCLPPPLTTHHHADSADNQMVDPVADLWRKGERVKYYCPNVPKKQFTCFVCDSCILSSILSLTKINTFRLSFLQ